jgi:hypothetical protein
VTFPEKPKTLPRPRTAVTLKIEPSALSVFYPLLQHGIRVLVSPGKSIQDFLCVQMGLEPEYVRERILSIMLDGKPVDDPETAALLAGSSLALSSGMPGLVGAVLRRGSPLASLRGTITYRESEAAGTKEEGIICVKLFNLIMTDLGFRFLEHGILINTGVLAEFLKENRPRLNEKCRGIQINGNPVSLRKFNEGGFVGQKEIFLSVVARETDS